jgi:hypothetical protein
VTPSSLWRTVEGDLADRDHDRTEAEKIASGETDAKYRDCLTTCPARGWHDWKDAEPHSEAWCPGCTKKADPSPETLRLSRLRDLMDGGAAFARSELPEAVWVALGRLRRKDAAELAMIGRF